MLRLQQKIIDIKFKDEHRQRQWINFINRRKISYREKQIRQAVPYTCYYCELLGMCRDETNNWKCHHHGCMVLNAERELKKDRERRANSSNRTAADDD